MHFGDVKKDHNDEAQAALMPSAAAMTPSTSHDNAFQKVAAQKEDDSSSSDSDDDLQHASEVPEHLSQGDLYLRGSRTAKRDQGVQGEDDPSLYGSREAMEHAVGATIEAVDRAMRASAGAQEQASSSPSPSSSRGTITPLGSTTAWPVFADDRIAGRIAMGAGEHGYSALVDAPALLAALGATVADISA